MEIETRKDDFLAAIAEMEEGYSDVFARSPALAKFDLDDASQKDAVFDWLISNKNTPEYWLYLSGVHLTIAKDAIERQDAQLAGWAIACAERFRSLYIFKEHFEETVSMGHSAKRLTELLNIWNCNKTNGNEGFWQYQFQLHSFAISQIFSVPVTFIEEKAYVGGQGIDRNDARFVDFLFSGGCASDAILVEIKTPTANLIQKSPYRKNVYAPSSELSGSIVQIADYRFSLNRAFNDINRSKKSNLESFDPKAVVIIGNSEELNNEAKKLSFELFRSGLTKVYVVTFDEIFLKIGMLASLFNLVRTSA